MPQPQLFNCCGCQMEFPDPRPVDLIAEPPRMGDIILCGMCGKPNVICITGTREITEEEISQLSPQEQSDINFATRAIAKHRRNN